MALRSARFEKRDRLRTRRDFTRVQSGGRRVSGRFVTLLILANECTAPRLGLIASRKLGPAVARNRAKRRLRDLFRRHRATLGEPAAYDIVAIPRREICDAPFADVEADFLNTLRRAGRRA